MTDKYAAIETYLRHLPVSQEEVILSFESIEQILKDILPSSAREDDQWWGNQKSGTQVESNAWMDAGWMVDIVNLGEQWVRFVRQ